MSPDGTLYFDGYQGDRAQEPPAMHFVSTLENVYEYEPKWPMSLGLTELMSWEFKRICGPSKFPLVTICFICCFLVSLHYRKQLGHRRKEKIGDHFRIGSPRNFNGSTNMATLTGFPILRFQQSESM
jgi:hypothetical protein